MQSPPRSCICLLSIVLAVAFTSQAQSPPSLPEWEHLSSEQREQLTAPLRDRWDNASPEQRTRMLSRAERWQQMEPDARRRISSTIGRWQDLPPGQHHELRAVFHHLRTLDDATERAAFLERWMAMTPEQRRAWAEEHPAPAHQGSPQRGPRQHRTRKPS